MHNKFILLLILLFSAGRAEAQVITTNGGGGAAASGSPGTTITGGTCTNQFVRALNTAGVPTCDTITTTDTDNTIAKTGVDINTSNQVTATHLTGDLPVDQGGTGAGTLTGILKGNGTSAVTAIPLAGNALKFLNETGAFSVPTATVSGDASTNTATSVVGEVALFADTSGKLFKRGTGSGLGLFTSGVFSTVAAPSGTVVGTSDSQALTNKTYNGMTVTSSTGTFTLANSKVLTVSNTLTFTATDGISVAFGTAGGTVAYTGVDINSSNQVTALHLAAALGVAAGGTGAGTHTIHGVMIGEGTSAEATTAVGTSGQVLTSNGAGNDPTFQTVSGTGTLTSIATTSPIGGGTITTTGTITCTTCVTSASALSAHGVVVGGGSQATVITGTGTAGQILTSNGASSDPTFQDAPAGSSSDLTFTSVTGATTVSTCGQTSLASGTSADYAITLPAISVHTGCTFLFHMSNALTKIVTITCAGSDTFDNLDTTWPMWAGENLTISNDGTTWSVVSVHMRPMVGVANRTASQSVSSFSVTKVLLDTTEMNVGSMWTSGSNFFTIRRGGKYRVGINVATVSGDIADNQQIQILAKKNATTYVMESRVNTSNSTPTDYTMFIEKPITLSAGDTIELTYYGPATTLVSGASFLSVQEITR